MKNKGKISFRSILGFLYPPIIYFSIQILLQYLVIEVISMYLSFGNTVDVTNYTADELNDMINNALNNNSLLILLFAALGTIPIMWLLMHLDKKKHVQMGTYVRYELVNKWSYLLIGPLSFFAMMGFNALVGLIMLYLPAEWMEAYKAVDEVIYSPPVVQQLLTAGIVAPIVEELIFRGVVYNRAKAISNKLCAAFISAIYFGVFHMNIVQGIYSFFLGLIMVFVYEKYHSLLAPILFHTMANSLGVLITYLNQPIAEDMQNQGISAGNEIDAVTQLYVFAINSVIYIFLTIVLLTVIYFVVKSNKMDEQKNTDIN